jgi:hypothetical protein
MFGLNLRFTGSRLRPRSPIMLVALTCGLITSSLSCNAGRPPIDEASGGSGTPDCDSSALASHISIVIVGGSCDVVNDTTGPGLCELCSVEIDNFSGGSVEFTATPSAEPPRVFPRDGTIPAQEEPLSDISAGRCNQLTGGTQTGGMTYEVFADPDDQVGGEVGDLLCRRTIDYSLTVQ